jgi:hypothetical protein
MAGRIVQLLRGYLPVREDDGSQGGQKEKRLTVECIKPHISALRYEIKKGKSRL